MLPRQALADAIRFLAADSVQKANSGHPGMPMGMADIAEVLWNDFLKHNPKNPHWINRDRFILSNGHGAMLQYALLHLTGYDLSIDDLKNFRQLHSKTPGHPEHGDTPGVETTTGPLAQGLANAVGMALAQKILAAEFNRPEFPIIDHFVYAFAGDGCLMEGLSHEVCSLAGTWGLDKLIVVWDDNHISIDGDTAGWFTVDVPKQFEAYGWHVIQSVDGHQFGAIHEAFEHARTHQTGKPTLICCQTRIGEGAPTLAGTSSVHGSPLGDKEIAAMRETLDCAHSPFEIPAEIYSAYNAVEKGKQQETAWRELFDAYQKKYPDMAAELDRRLSQTLPESWSHSVQRWIEEFKSEVKPLATRKTSQMVIAKLASVLPELLGGSADLTCSNLTDWPGMKSFSKEEPAANYIYYGVREFGMSAIMNGIALYQGFIPFGGTFLVFQSYAANATRMAAIMKQRVIFVYTHDSIGLGEDGPTHQPIMEAATLRMTPHMTVWRPCDLLETMAAWQAAIEKQDGPSALLLSRQAMPQQKRDPKALVNMHRGGYCLLDAERTPDLIIIATGSEVSLAIGAALELQAKDYIVRVVSMPSCEVFMAQDEAYRESILPRDVRKRIVIEASATDYWYKFAGLDGVVIGMSRFGASAPEKIVMKECGFTVEHVLEVAYSLLK